jgi:2-methylcitrate dehydratase PrpD
MTRDTTLAQRLGTFVAGLRYDQLPIEVVEAEKLHILDTLGCGIAALGLGEVAWIRDAIAHEDASGPATVIGGPRSLAPESAALVNGTLCHALDFDDTHAGSVVHVSASIVAAVLAGGETVHATGADVVCAGVIGSEVSTRLGMVAGGEFHARGFHPTGVCGVFGCAAAAARLFGLDAATTANALGLAGSMASGLLEFLADGSNTKPLHPGWAAHSGILAAKLARAGATGPKTILGGQRGFFNAYLSRADLAIDEAFTDLGAQWQVPRIAFKPYPACHYIHAPLDALEGLLSSSPVRPEEIAEIVAFSDRTGFALVLDPIEDKLVPRTPYDAKFSLPYCLAYRFVHGPVGVAAFTSAAIGDTRVLDLARKVRGVEKRYAPVPDSFPGGVRLTMQDGEVLERELRFQRGGTEYPLSQRDVVTKFHANAALGLSPAAASGLEAFVMGLENDHGLDGFGVVANASPRTGLADAAAGR